MAINEFLIYEFRPLYLTLDRIGPFQQKMYEIDFTDQGSRPCNFFMLVAANGFGKTTTLDILGCLLGMLDDPQLSHLGHEDLDSQSGRAQLDILLRCYWQGADLQVVLSLLGGTLGEDLSLKVWPKNDLEEYRATSWHRAGYIRRASGTLRPLPTHKSDELVADLLGFFQFNKGEVPKAFGQSAFSAPTTLSFSAYRDIPNMDSQKIRRVIEQPKYWGYQSLHQFSAHNTDWHYSLDNLLVWLKWLDDGRFEQACNLINGKVFSGTEKFLKDVKRDPPEAFIQVNNDETTFHRLNRLSSGEKNLVQIFLRIGAHMTQNTILLIDEFDVHLHIRWQFKLLNALKELAAQQDANFTVILTTHSTEILETYTGTLDINEEGLVKGGHFIKDLR